MATTIETLDELADNRLSPKEQDESKATIFKRKNKTESELAEKELKMKSSSEIFNFARALEDPYPNARIKVRDGVLFLKRVEMAKNKESQNTIPILKLKEMTKADLNDLLGHGIIVKCTDGRNIEIKEAIVKSFEE